MSRLVRFQRVLMEADVIIGLLVFGVMTMFADLLADLDHPLWAAIVRGVGLAGFIICGAYILWQRVRVLAVPLLFTEETDRQKARNMFEQFVEAASIRSSIRVMESFSPVRQTDLVIVLHRPNPRNCPDPHVWKDAWEELLREWEREVDRGLGSQLPCYHILPHVALPLSFALGASVACGAVSSYIIASRRRKRFSLSWISPRIPGSFSSLLQRPRLRPSSNTRQTFRTCPEETD